MSRSVDRRLDGVKFKPLEMDLRPSGEAPSRNLTPEAFAGQVLADILHESKATPKELSVDLQHGDQSIVSRWLKGDGLPKLFVLLVNSRRYRKGTVKGLIDIPGDRMRSETLVHIDEDEVAS